MQDADLDRPGRLRGGGLKAALTPPRAANVTAAAPIPPKRRRVSVKSAVAMLFVPPFVVVARRLRSDHRVTECNRCATKL